MKVGTDGVIIGAWTVCNKRTNILDIGCGTGLISLMLAQRNDTAVITGIEIEENAFLQSQDNFNNSKWRQRLSIIHTSLQDFSSETKFDLIVSNPPFFTDSTQANNQYRKFARSTNSLNFKELVSKSKTLLSKNGIFSVIIPFPRKEEFISVALENNLHLRRICNVKGTANSPVKRVLMQFNNSQNTILEENLIIEKERHNYTDKYIDLCKYFYLKM
jgi:tRNA1Val (adenine37-N6)-methyltransferase